MQQKVTHTKIIIDGVVDETLTLSMKDLKYGTTVTEVTMTIEDAMELHRLLGNKLGEIPA